MEKAHRNNPDQDIKVNISNGTNKNHVLRKLSITSMIFAAD